MFRAVFDPEPDLVAEISELAPENPFHTPQYVEVRKKLGFKPCAFVFESDGAAVSGCLGFLSRGRLNSRIEITSLPVISEPRTFWDGVFDFCRIENASVLSVHTFSSINTAIDERKNLVSHKKRSEYRLSLTQPDLLKAMNRRSRRMINKATEEGFFVCRSSDSLARQTHVGLANSSLDRRRGKGDLIDSAIELAEVDAFIDCGAGEIVQLIGDNTVHATMLIARSPKGGYAQSSGTSSYGRENGASHFLFYEAARLLQAEGATIFNLGGADEHSVGLQEFKIGLGSERIELESAEFFVGSRWKRFASEAIGRLKGITQSD